MRSLTTVAFIALLGSTLLIGCQPVSSTEFRLKYVQDGDSVILCCDAKDNNFTVRLKDIDAPEKHQPFANESKNYLHQLLNDKALILVGNKKDRYGRVLADILIDDQSVNRLMVKTGHAWVWRFSDNLKLKWLQKQAKKKQIGLWALPKSQRIEPWTWRKKKR